MASKVQSSDPGPGEHPEPPTELGDLVFPLANFDSSLFRCHQKIHNPLFFSDGDAYRFNAPAQQFGTCYFAPTVQCCFLETYRHDTASASEITKTELEKRLLATIQIIAPPLILIDISGPGLAQIGADARLTTGNYRIAQRWSLFFWNNSQADGLLYRSRIDPDLRSIALYERASKKLKHTGSNSFLSSELIDAFNGILTTYNIEYIDDTEPFDPNA